MISFDDNSPPDPLPNFCIRDYVFSSRNKDIASNWPFSQKTLQICLKNEVKNLLPPFESLESLKNTSSNEQIYPKLSLESKQDFGQQKSTKSALVCSQKSNTIEEVTAMASKVCPVCKTYSSSSNTALNAHIDQCLFGEPSTRCTMKPDIKPRTKPRIKPRKIRLMSEVYKTAPHCTVEELDARNGRISSANNSGFSVKEEETKSLNILRNVADNEGDVYIDKNGTKVRILSVPKVNTVSNCGARKLLKRGISSKSFTEKKKNKQLKLSPSGKKLCKRKTSKVKTAREENDNIEEKMGRDDYPIVRPPWACSKRTFLAKRVNLRTPLPLLKPSCLDSRLLNGSNIGSKGGKFSSSKKKIVLVSRDSASKLNFKRKKSGLKNGVAGPVQDSSNRPEEDSGVRLSFVSTDISTRETSNGDSTQIATPLTGHVESAREVTRSLNLELPNDNIDIEMQDINVQKLDPILVSEKVNGNSSLASEEHHYYDMSESPVSTISNPVLAKSDSEKFFKSSALLKDDTRGFLGAITAKQTPVISTSTFENDYRCCSYKNEPVFNQTVASGYQEASLLTARMFSDINFPISEPPPPMKLTAYNECDSVSSPSKPVLRLMGKNLTVVNTDHELNCGQFPSAQNEHKFPSNPTLFQNTTYADYFTSPQVGPIIPQNRVYEDWNRFGYHMMINEINVHKPPPNSVNNPIFIDDFPKNEYTHNSGGNSGGIPACSSFGLPFGKWYRTPTAGSSKSSAM